MTTIMLQPINDIINRTKHFDRLTDESEEKINALRFSNNTAKRKNNENGKKTMRCRSQSKPIELGERTKRDTAITSNPTPIGEDSVNNSAPHRISFITGDDFLDLYSELAHFDAKDIETKKTVRFAPLPQASNDPTEDSERANDKNKTTTDFAHSGLFTEEERRELWYQNDELALMKREAREAIEKHKGVFENPNSTAAEREQVIGLERFSRQRAVWKRSAIHYILTAQRQGNKKLKSSSTNVDDQRNLLANFIQRISLRCTGWARETAKMQGFRDYCAAHDPLASLLGVKGKDGLNYNELIFGDNNNTNKSSRSTNAGSEGKRKLGAEEPARKQRENNRRARQRTESVV
eukprot:CAMPEP_0172362022 /NCGR_PEP_ID=MMETSP1060-20121228/5731_1 /TAXON_ID=37318 /ORGANISM="Pseudo-nitzschia pungens, Strain cf. cingulata" /LENGTH=349 /DNA_ID=CAMNT_0013084439 /DNA_START=182 /DNA_END=1231 /DNA_ORIENTATION=+